MLIRFPNLTMMRTHKMAWELSLCNEDLALVVVYDASTDVYGISAGTDDLPSGMEYLSCFWNGKRI